MRTIGIIVGVLVLLISPTIYSSWSAERRLEKIRGMISPGLDWLALMQRLEADPPFMFGLNFSGNSRDCGYVYRSQSGAETILVVHPVAEGPIDAPNPKRREVKLKGLQDPALREHAKRCPAVKVTSHEKFGFSHLDFQIRLDPEQKVIETSPTRVWD